jgi:hypothetical protein
MAYENFPLAIALRVGTLGGLTLTYTGIRRFDLSRTSLETLVKEVAARDFTWPKPVVKGKLRTALSIHVDQPQTTLVFVLDPQLHVEFAAKPILAASELAEQALSDVRLWPQRGDKGGPLIASVAADCSKLTGHGDVKFNLAVDNVGQLDGEPYRTPIFIDPDWPWPDTSGGIGGGGPP